jgi:hypothetical protein
MLGKWKREEFFDDVLSWGFGWQFLIQAVWGAALLFSAHKATRVSLLRWRSSRGLGWQAGGG